MWMWLLIKKNIYNKGTFNTIWIITHFLKCCYYFVILFKLIIEFKYYLI